MRLPVHLQREIARLHFYDPSQSSRALARACGLSPNTVQSMRGVLQTIAKPWPELQSLDDDAWRVALGTEDRSIAQFKPAPDWDSVHAEMQRPDATLERLWREWRESCPAGIGYSQFATQYRGWVKRQHVVMRRSHRPGDKLFVDFAGRTVEVRDPTGGPSLWAQVFVAVLGHSNFTYIEAVASQTTADWIQCHAHCFDAMGGVPQWVVSDNLKAAVWRRERERIVINPAYRDCLMHYDTAPLPTGPRKPRHKAKAEVGVQIAQRWVLFALRDRVFFSLAELNDELKRLTVVLNDHPFQKLPGCRRERFEAAERSTLKPLPGLAFELSDWRYGVRVQDDHHVEHVQCHYSVPHHLAREHVDLRFTQTMLEVFHRGRRVALHPLLTTIGTSITVPEHRPTVHQRVLEGEPRDLQAWAARTGEHVLRVVEHHLAQRADVTNGVKTARKLRDLARLHGDERLEQVCAYAWPLNITSLRSLTSILKEGADRRPRTTPPSAPRVQGELRGPAYYKEAV
jgi:transposase